MQAALPGLLFRRCHLNCVDSDTFSAESEAEKSCITNCQDKVYASFDIYMGIRGRKEALARNNIDKAAFIGMETEHSFDTSGTIDAAGQKTINLDSIKYFVDKNQRDNKDIRTEAYKKQ